MLKLNVGGLNSAMSCVLGWWCWFCVMVFLQQHIFMLLKWPWRGAPLLPTRPKGTGLASLSGPVSPRNSGCAVLPWEFLAPSLSRFEKQERRPCSSSSVAHCNRTRTACKCKLRRASTAHAVLRDLIAEMQHEEMPLCAGAHRPPAHLTACSNALGTRAANTVSSRSAPARLA